MKKLFPILACCFILFSFAAIDTDSDGVTDEKDICPRVYARSFDGCPTLTTVTSLTSLNACYQAQKDMVVVRIQPICDAVTKVCPVIS